jgi:hypothetical protein
MGRDSVIPPLTKIAKPPSDATSLISRIRSPVRCPDRLGPRTTSHERRDCPLCPDSRTSKARTLGINVRAMFIHPISRMTSWALARSRSAYT